MFPAAVAVVVLYLVAYFTIPSLPLPSYPPPRPLASPIPLQLFLHTRPFSEPETELCWIFILLFYFPCAMYFIVKFRVWPLSCVSWSRAMPFFLLLLQAYLFTRVDKWLLTYS